MNEKSFVLNFEETEVIVKQHNEVGNIPGTVYADCHCCKFKLFCVIKNSLLLFCLFRTINSWTLISKYGLMRNTVWFLTIKLDLKLT